MTKKKEAAHPFPVVKLVVWPRGPLNKKKPNGHHRYVVIGMLITPYELPEYPVSSNEFVAETVFGELFEEAMRRLQTRKPKIRTGDASDVLLSLGDL